MPVFNPSTGAGLINWTESNTLYGSTYYNKLEITSAQANVDAVISPKGTGAFSLKQADGNTNGNERGTYAVDLSLERYDPANVASGNYSLNAGQDGRASGFSAVNLASFGMAAGPYSVNLAVGGIASGDYAVCLGDGGSATGNYSINLSHNGSSVGEFSLSSGYAAKATMYGEYAHASGTFNAVGDAQRREMVLRGATSDNTPKVLTADQGLTGGTLNQLILQNNQSVTAQILVTCKKTATTASTAHFRLTVSAVRGANAASTVVRNVVTDTLYNPDSVTITATADTTNGGVTLTVTTPAGNWQTVADIYAVSTIYA